VPSSCCLGLLARSGVDITMQAPFVIRLGAIVCGTGRLYKKHFCNAMQPDYMHSLFFL